MFDYARLNELWYGQRRRRRAAVRHARGSAPSIRAIPTRLSGGRSARASATARRFASQVADLLEGLARKRTWTPGFRQGAAVRAVCDAMQASAACRPVGEGSAR